MNDIVERALDAAAAQGASYSDCRVINRREQVLVVKDGLVAGVRLHETEGVGVRLIVDGAWGFAGVGDTSAVAVDAAVSRAVGIARASAALQHEPVRLAEQAPISGEYRTPVVIDPFSVSIEDKLALLMRADAAMGGVAGVTTRSGSLESVSEDRWFGSSEGSRQHQVITECGGGLDVLAAGDGDVQMRSYPNSFGRHQQCAGWEFIDTLRLDEHGEQTASEAVALLTADLCPSGRMTVILDGTQAALQVHESCGHATELDRALGSEAAYAGMSFLTPDLLGGFRYGSDAVTITADATRAGGLGTFGWDDEGVPAQRTVLIDRGRFAEYMTSRESAASLGLPSSSGAMRAFGWNYQPLIRMTNVNLEAGTSSLEEMIASTDHGVYLETNRSWSIDDRRLNFQFGTQVGWEIRDGRRVRLLRNPLYSGVTPEFWGSCDAVAGPDEWEMWGVVNCGKGQPSQMMHVGHGAAPARFQNVAVRPS